MRGCRAAASADHVYPCLQQFRQPRRHRLRRMGINPSLVAFRRRSRIRSREEGQVRLLSITANDLDNVVHADVAATIDAQGGNAMPFGVASECLRRVSAIGRQLPR